MEKFTKEEKQKAQKIREIVKDPNHTLSQLNNAIPFESEVAVRVLSCLANMLKEEVENDKIASQEYRTCMNNVINVLNQSLKDNKISQEERQNIIEALQVLGKSYSEVEGKRIEQSGKNKRFFGGLLAGIAALILTILLILSFITINNNCTKHERRKIIKAMVIGLVPKAVRPFQRKRRQLCRRQRTARWHG